MNVETIDHWHSLFRTEQVALAFEGRGLFTTEDVAKCLGINRNQACVSVMGIHKHNASGKFVSVDHRNGTHEILYVKRLGRRGAVVHVHNGVHGLKNIAAAHGIHWKTLGSRLTRGMTIEEVLAYSQAKPLEYGGCTGLMQIARKYKISADTLASRLRRGMPIAEAVSKPVNKKMARRERGEYHYKQVKRKKACPTFSDVQRLALGI